MTQDVSKRSLAVLILVVIAITMVTTWLALQAMPGIMQNEDGTSAFLSFNLEKDSTVSQTSGSSNIELGIAG